ncbi:MAG: SRPBCC family protein [Actinomycetota bacterium]
MTEPEWPTTGSASIRIAASPEAAYDYVTDLDTLPSLSPENQRCEFIEGSTEIVEGALFRGHNEHGGYEWSAECRVVEADRGRVFSFVVPPAWEYATTWKYTFEADGDGVVVTESFDSPMLQSPDIYPGRLDGRSSPRAPAIGRSRRWATASPGSPRSWGTTASAKFY